MNIALEKTEEFVDGTKRRSYGDAFVRGNNGKSAYRPFYPATVGILFMTSRFLSLYIQRNVNFGFSHVHLRRLVTERAPWGLNDEGEERHEPKEPQESNHTI